MGLFHSVKEKRKRRELEEDVYKKLYRYIFDLHKKNSPRGYPISNEVWSEIKPDVLRRIDRKMKDEFDMFSEQVKKWNLPCRTIYNNFDQHVSDLTRTLEPEFKQNTLVNESGNISVENNSYSIDSFIRFYLIALLNLDIRDPEMLYKIMVEFVQMYYPFRAGEIIYLKNNNPLFFEVLFKHLPAIRQMCLENVDYDAMIKHGKIIKDHITELREKLVRKVNEQRL